MPSRLVILFLFMGAPARGSVHFYIASLFCQSSSDSVQTIREQFNSPKWESRYQALKNLKSTSLSDASKIQLALELLAIERKFIDDSTKAERSIDEGYSDPYYTELLELAFRATLRTPSESEFEELMQSSFNPGSRVAVGLARFGNRYFNVLEQLRSAPNQYVRINVIAVGLLSIRDLEVDHSLRRRTMRIVGAGLSDEAVEVRAAAVNLLGATPGIDSVALLKNAQSEILNGKVRRDRTELERIESALRKLQQ